MAIDDQERSETQKRGESFVQLPAVILMDPELSPGARVCWGILKLYARDNGVAWPSQETIGKDMGRGVTRVKEYLKALEDRSYIKRVPRKGDTDLIHLLLDVVKGGRVVRFLWDDLAGKRVEVVGQPTGGSPDSDGGGGRVSGYEVDAYEVEASLDASYIDKANRDHPEVQTPSVSGLRGETQEGHPSAEDHPMHVAPLHASSQAASPPEGGQAKKQGLQKLKAPLPVAQPPAQNGPTCEKCWRPAKVILGDDGPPLCHGHSRRVAS